MIEKGLLYTTGILKCFTLKRTLIAPTWTMQWSEGTGDVSVHPALYHLRRNHEASQGRMHGPMESITFKISGIRCTVHMRKPSVEHNRDQYSKKCRQDNFQYCQTA